MLWCRTLFKFLWKSVRWDSQWWSQQFVIYAICSFNLCFVVLPEVADRRSDTIKAQPLLDTKLPSCSISQYHGSAALRWVRRSYKYSWECHLAPWTQKDENPQDGAAWKWRNTWDFQREQSFETTDWNPQNDSLKIFCKPRKKNVFVVKSILEEFSGSLPIGSHSM